MEKLPLELFIEIYQYIQYPISLILLNRKFHQWSVNPISKSNWALSTFGRVHVLFYAIALGKAFITADVISSLLALKANFSRYFVQRLLLHYSRYEELNKLKLQGNNDNNSEEIDKFKAFQKEIKTQWASDIPFSVFILLLNEAEARFGPISSLRCNDIENFHFLTSGQLPIGQAAKKIKDNLEEIQDLIINQKFTPFPPRPKIPYSDTHDYSRQMQIINREEFPAKDGYENNKHLHIIARAILLENNLVDIWKEIGYYDICRDVNDLVIQECILRLFPLNPPVGWHDPTRRKVVNELSHLINIGFKLTKSVMVNILCFCENQLGIIGDSILLEAFHEVRQEPKTVIIQKCLIEITQVYRETNEKVLDFLISNKNGSELEIMFLKIIIYHFFDTESKQEFDNMEVSFMQSREATDTSPLFSFNNSCEIEDPDDNNDGLSLIYGSNPFVHKNTEAELLNKYQNLLYINHKKIKNYDIENPINGMRTLSLRSSLYSWILKKFGSNSTVTKLCFHDIILSKVWIDVEKQRHPERDITTIVRECAINSIILIYEEFCKSYVPFEILHMELLKKSNEKSTLELFFEAFLPRVFDIKSTYKSEFDEEVKETVDGNDNNDNSNRLNDIYSRKWISALEKECKVTSSKTLSTNLFEEYVITICNRIDEEKNCTIKFG